MLAKSKSYSDTPRPNSAHKTEAAHNILRLPTIILPLLTIVLLTSLNILSASALTYQDNVELQFTWNPTIRTSLSSADLVINNLTPGNSADSNTITINVSTNNMYGYTLSATAGNTTNASTNLVNTVDNTKLFTSLATDASLASLTTDNTWGYSFSTNSGTSWSNYSGLPLYTAAAGAELVNNDGSGSTPVQFKIAAKASAIQASGAYTNTINFTAVANPEPTPQSITCDAGKICYSENALDSEGTMADQDIVKAKDWSSCLDTDYESYCDDHNYNEIDINTLPELDLHIAPLLASNFSRTGYGFAGWSDKFDYATNPEAKFYGPNETITLNPADYTNGKPGLSLYAVWVKSQGSLQDSAKVASVCSNLTQAGPSVTPTLASVSALTDSRDNNTYAIAKLADGKCWMIENMRLDSTPELSSANTNNPSLPLTNIYDATNPTTSNHLSASITPSSSTPWCTTTYSAACYDQSMLYTGNTTDRGSSPATSANTYSYGNYYNWYSATAGNGKYANGYGYIVPGDICPAGWTLPTSGSASMNFDLLDVALGGPGSISNSSTTPTGAVMSAAYRSYPNNFLYSGYIYGSSVLNRGSSGDYLSKSASGDINAYNLRFESSYVDPSDRSHKFAGQGVRCLAQ